MDTQSDDSWKALLTPTDIALIQWLEEDDDPLIQEFSKYLKVKSLQPLPTHHIKSCHLFDLSSISLPKNSIPKLQNGNHGLKVYGRVQLIDYDAGNKFTLFERSSSTPLSVSLLDSDSISIILQKNELGRPYLVPESLTLEISLRDLTRDICLINASRVINFKPCVQYDQILDIEIPNTSKKGGYFRVGCTLFQCAVVASVEFQVLRNETGSHRIERNAYVYGTISGTFRVRNGFQKHAIFYETEPQKMKFEHPLWLSPLAVPAYSSLLVHVDLKVNGEKISCDDPWECEAMDVGFSPGDKEIQGHKYRILMRCRWMSVLELPTDDIVEWNDIDGASSGEEEKILRGREGRFEKWKDINEITRNLPAKKLIEMTMQKQKKLRVSYHRQPQPNLRERKRIICSEFPQELVEIFSISVLCYDIDDVVNLTGIIECYDMKGKYKIFERDISNPEFVNRSNVLSLSDTRFYEGAFFGANLTLKDGEGVEICRGCVSHNDHTVVYDKRLCSVIPGKRGFACVYYTMFKDAEQATIRVIFNSKKGFGVYEVRGSIRARYSSYIYSTHHDFMYYQSNLFEKDTKLMSRNKDDSAFVELKHGDEIPLIKHMVAVPLNASLIVDLNLSIGMKDDTTSEVVKLMGKAKFKAKMSETKFLIQYGKSRFKNEKPKIEPQAIGDDDNGYEALVFVEWG